MLIFIFSVFFGKYFKINEGFRQAQPALDPTPRSYSPAWERKKAKLFCTLLTALMKIAIMWCVLKTNLK
jgi:hypothetical protein